MTHPTKGETKVGHTPTLLLTDRLRGKYVLPVNDGAGPLNGSTTFERNFPTPPIQQEAADMIDELRAALQRCAEARMPGEARRIARAALSKSSGPALTRGEES